MTDFPSLAQVADEVTDNQSPFRHRSGYGLNHLGRNIADAWTEACTIRTVEELDALPEGAIIRGALEGHAYEKSMKWTMVGRRWWEAGNSSPERSEDIELPALLIWHPGWGRP